MTQKQAVAYLRQICCSGLNSEIVIVEFLRALHHAIPSLRNYYQIVDEEFIPSIHIPDYFIPEFEKLAETFTELFSLAYNPEFVHEHKSLHYQLPFITDRFPLAQKFYKIGYYDLIHRPLDQHYIIEARVMHQGRILGLVALCRSRRSPPFNVNEQRLCVQLTHYVAHAMQVKGDEAELPYADSGESGMMILDKQGAILYMSDSAKQLLTLSRFTATDQCVDNAGDAVMAHLKQLCRQLTAIFEDKPAPPPAWSHTNANGRFNFRAYWLNRQQLEPGGLIGIMIEHQEPLTIKLLRILQTTALSPLQKDVALMLAQGKSNDQIGKHLHIKPNTVKDHLRKIFIKLDIHQREEVLSKLLAMETAPRILKGVNSSFH